MEESKKIEEIQDKPSELHETEEFDDDELEQEEAEEIEEPKKEKKKFFNKANVIAIAIIAVLIIICLIIYFYFPSSFSFSKLENETTSQSCSSEQIKNITDGAMNYCITTINARLVEMAKNCEPIVAKDGNTTYVMTTRQCFNKL